MVLSPRQCLGVERRVCERFLPPKEHNPHCLCIACIGKPCHPDNQYDECHEWSEERCRSDVEYAEKLSLQRERKKEQKTKSSSSSFSGFFPSMSVPLEQLSSTDLGVITTAASLTAVCAVMFAVAVPTVTSVPITSSPGLLVPDLTLKSLMLWVGLVHHPLIWMGCSGCGFIQG